MLISLFTPTYNRANLITRVYDSLISQSNYDFEWLIVDDGSTDNIREVVENIKSKHNALFSIRYIYKKNGGKHTAVNVGVHEAKGELFFILDSDDYLPSDALKIVAEEYAKVRDADSDFDSDSNSNFNSNSDENESKSRSMSKSKFAGVAGLDRFADGRTVGNGLPCDSIDCNAMDIRYKYHVTGDMKEVFRTEVLKEFPFPEIEGERFCPEQLVWFRIAQKYKLHYFNKPIYIAEYQEGGITAGITRARMNSPIATMMCYAELNGYDVPFKQKVKAAINYWRFRFCAKGGKYPTINPLWSFVIPLAFVMHLKDKHCQSQS